MLTRTVGLADSIDLHKIAPYSGVFQSQKLIKPLSNTSYMLLLHSFSKEILLRFSKEIQFATQFFS